MKKKKHNKIFGYIFYLLFVSFLVIYFSELTGYYEYQNHKKTALTEEQIRQFEIDVKSGKEVDLDKYLIAENKTYNNTLSKLASKFSDSISDVVKNGVETAFKFLSKFVDD